MKQTKMALLWWSHLAVVVAGLHTATRLWDRLLGAGADAEQDGFQPAAFFNSRHGRTEEQTCGFNSTHKHPVWEAYAKLHREGRAALERGKPVKTLIWHCRSGEECRGNADQIRGLSTALYLAVATKRVLLVEWARNGAEITSLFSSGHIDWSVPARLDCESEVGVTWWQVHAPKRPWEALGDMGEQCVYLKSNRAPEDMGSSTGLDGVVHLWRGCAFNFLFREAKPLVDLLSSRMPQPQPSQKPSVAGEAPFVGMHLRFGDETWGKHCYMMQPTAKVVESALACVVKMGQSMFKPEEEWNVLLVTDNMEMKKLAMDPAWITPVMKRLGEPLRKVPRVFTTVDDDGNITEPAHTNFLKDAGDSKRTQTLVLDAWADQLSLARAEGVLATFGGFAVSSAEIGLLPRPALWHFDSDSGACQVHGGAEAIRQSSSREAKKRR